MLESNSYTYKITPEQGKQLHQRLAELYFEFSPLQYGHFSARRGKCVINYYTSGKLLIQGKQAREFIEFELEPKILKEVHLGYEEIIAPDMFKPHFGIDESGKGDFFGPLVVAGVYVDEKIARNLIDIGVKDSKRIQSDAKAKGLAKEIRKCVGKQYNVIAIGPERYNELHRRMKNLNFLLAWGHAKVIEILHTKNPACPRALSDQFAHPSVVERQLGKKKIVIRLEQRTKAESDIAVAAASILARAKFIEGLEDLSRQFKIKLKKGAGAAVKEQALQIARSSGIPTLQKITKTHFKTFQEIRQAIG